MEPDGLHVVRRKGKVAALEQSVESIRLTGTCGIGHTRWATHGKPSEANAHPQISCDGSIAVVHNGIIENFAELREKLEGEGHHFASATDTEVVAHLVERAYDGDLLAAVRTATECINGAYGLAVTCAAQPGVIVVTRKDSPLVVGRGATGSYVASDMIALLEATRDIVILEDGQFAQLTPMDITYYDANGNKKSETLGNGVISTYTYNKANRITKIENKKGNSNISVYEYSYYLDGSDACKVRNENGIIETTEYEYDGLKRLTEESVKVGNSTDTYAYEYDDYGNRSKMTATGSENYVTEYSYNNAQGKYTALLQKETKTVEDDNALKLQNNVKQTVYTYDANGNQITKTADGKTETNTYDGLNQLIGFTDGETTASYTYGISGLRDSKTVNGVTTTHIWSGSQIVVDYTAHYTSTVYIRGTSLAAAFDWDEGSKGDNRFYIQNAHGDVVNLTNADGEVTKKYTYDAFGVEKNIDDSDANPFRYCGEYYDAETGTIYLRARYYNPSTGRFISRDSVTGDINDPLSLNLYTYCHNNPIFYLDPTGHNAWTNFWNEFVDCWKVGSSDFREAWNVGNNEIASRGKVGELAASFNQGVVDTLSSQAESTVKTVRNPGKAIKKLGADYVSYGKKNPLNWNPTNYIAAKNADEIVNTCKNSYNLGLEYGANGVAYALGQSTTIVAETAVIAYGPDAVADSFNSIKNALSKCPRTLKGCVTYGSPFNAEQNALIQMGKYYDKVGYITMEDAEAYVALAQEAGLNQARIDMGHATGSAVSRNPHLHIGTGSYHIPIE